MIPGRGIAPWLELAAATFLLATVLPASAVYKWVDEKGRTHYSEEPPPDGRKGEKVELKVTPPSSDAKPADWKKRELDARKARIEADQKDEYLKAKAHNEMAERKNRCSRAQRQLEVLGRERPVYTRNDKGEKVYLEDKERAAEAERWRKEADTHCAAR